MESTKQNISQSVSYAQVTQNSTFPTKEQAVILDAIEGIQVQEYVLQLAKIVEPRNIRFVSRISHGRICFYLNSKQTADNLTENHKKINIGSHELEIRPLISKAKRIILSNVCPIIPHHVIIEELQKLNIRHTSQMTFIRAGYSDSSLAHILCFRRQIYIQPEDITKIPPCMQINFDDTPYYIYLSSEKLTCFLCKQEGHVAKFCKNTDILSQNFPIISKGNHNTHPVTILQTNQEKINNITQNYTSNNQNILTTPNPQVEPEMAPPVKKRALPSSQSSSSPSVTILEKDVTHGNINNSKKKPKKQIKLTKEELTPEYVSSQLNSMKELFSSNVDTFPLTFENTIDFLINIYDNPKVLETARQYTTDIAGLSNMLAEMKSQATDTKLKNRLNRVVLRLTSSLEKNKEESSSDPSSSAEEM